MPLPEKSLIAELRSMAQDRRRQAGSSFRRRSKNSAVIKGIGDDCAVLRLPGAYESLVTTDFTLEGIHFRRDWHAPESVGHRCLTRGLSDIAAMGGKPVAAFLSLALPQDLPQYWVRRFARGLTRLAQKYGVILAGGDTAESPDGILADIIVVGSVPRGKAILRSGARPGDRIFVSGELGGSAAAVVAMRAEPTKKVTTQSYARHFYPEARIELGATLRKRHLASAMIDTSDGLSTDISHICEESGVGAEVEAVLLPRAKVGKPVRDVGLDLALHGGEDYELLFTVPSGKRVPAKLAGVALTEIGRITRSRKVILRDAKDTGHVLKARGWEHFRS